MTPVQPKHIAVFTSLWHLLRATFAEWSKDSAPVLGAALAFYTLFSLAPLLIILTVVAGYFLGQQAVQAELLNRLSEYVGPENASNLMQVIQSTYNPESTVFATITAVCLMLFGSSSVFLMLKHALNNMWGLAKTSPGLASLVLDRLKSFLGVLSVGFLLFCAMVLKSLLAAFYTNISRFLVVPGIVLDISDHAFSFLFTSLLFAVLFKVLPDTRVSWRFAGRGAFVSALLFTFGNVFLGFYLTRQTVASAYGAAGSLVVILLWVYYSALIIFLGAEFTQVYARRSGESMD
jgi:membrane protein